MAVPHNHCILDRRKPRNIFSLNGVWEIAGTHDGTPPGEFVSTIPVPAVVDMADPPYEWQQWEYHWYRTTFSIGQIPPTHFLFLKIEQSMFGTEVWLNGHPLGGTLSCYTSHEYLLNEWFHPDKPNELLVRVGAKSTLPPESAVGRDQEKEIYTPGVWGDVSLLCVGGARVQLVQVIPHIQSAVAEARVWIRNLEFKRQKLLVSARIFEKNSEEAVSPIVDVPLLVDDHATAEHTFQIPIDAMKVWSPEHPFLYEIEVTVQEGTQECDTLRTTFGMREFTVHGADFYLNGKKILLRGGNIAFHRFLSDRQRKLLPWNELWIKKALIDIPKEHHFNFFRNHLGQMYNKWYDIADEYGMLIQNEWQFWCVTGTDRQVKKELTEWLQDNWNHPSIVIWDPINESTDAALQREIVPALKKLDPTRPWESVDFLEEHPYIYSLGMVLNDRKFGFARSLEEMENLPVPSMVNEFLWWWFNDQWEPTVLTQMIVRRWMGKEYTTDELIAHQSFLAQELIELFRRIRLKAIQPFVYISNNDGPTAHWFLGDIANLQPKPVLAAVKNAFAPFGVSIELWDRHFFTKERRQIRLFVFNDTQDSREGLLRFGIASRDGTMTVAHMRPVVVPPVGDLVVTEEFVFPPSAGEYTVVAELVENGSIIAASSKSAHVFDPVPKPDVHGPVGLCDPSGEIASFLLSCGVHAIPAENVIPESASAVILHGNILGSRQYTSLRKNLTQWVNNGGTLFLMEPEFRVVGDARYAVVEGIDVIIHHRADLDKGGYDSYVFAEDHAHPIWKNIRKEHLKMFNGAYGGEIVSQYDVDFSVSSRRLASCGIDLKVNAASEVKCGKGKIVLFRLQLRGRLSPSFSEDALFARRTDPVAQQLLMNLLEYSQR